MLTIMCTTDLWRLLDGRSRLVARPAAEQYDTYLAVWSAKAVLIPDGIFCVAVNEATCLTVAFPLFPLPAFIAAFGTAMAFELEHIGIRDSVVTRELDAFFHEVVFAKNSSRALLGSLNGVSLRFESAMGIERTDDVNLLLRVQHQLNRMPHPKRDVPIPVDAVALLLGSEVSETDGQPN